MKYLQQIAFTTSVDGSYFILVDIRNLRVSEKCLARSEDEERRLCVDGIIPRRTHDWKVGGFGAGC